MATIRLIPSTYSTSSTYVSVSNANNMYANTDSTNYATATTSRSGNTYVYIKGFNFTDVPSDALVDSFSIKLKASMSGVSTNTNYRPVLCNNTTGFSSGSSVLSTSVQTITFTGVSQTWDTIRGYGSNFAIRLNARRSSNNTTSYIYIYGAEIEVNYRVPIYHNVTATLSTDNVDSIDPAGLTSVLEGDDYTLAIYAESADDFKVEDNGTDVTSSLVRHDVVPGTNTFTGAPVSFDSENSVYDRTGGDNGNGIYSSNTIANGCTPATSTTRCALYSVQQNSAASYMYYNFDCSSIPLNAEISSVSCSFKGGTQGSTYYSAYIAQMCAGTTAKGSSVSVTGTNTSPSTVTVNGGNSWTRNELNDLKIKFQVTRNTSSSSSASTFSFYGATVSINYTVPAGNPYYWTYTLSNVTTAHTIIVGDAIIVPPEEDPTKEYYPITISSINATTEPGRGTTRLESGTTETNTIYPSDPLITLVTDNGVDISSQLVAHGGAIPDPTVTTLAGASYGFTLNSSTSYYVSQNTGVDKSAAVSRVTFNLPVRCLVTISFINYAEATYDFGVFGNIDTALSSNYYAAGSGGATITDQSYKLACNTSTYNTSSVQTLTYEIPSGEHFIDIKFSKDDATASNNDSLQWKITSIEALEPNNYYTYTLSNISQEHSLIFIFGDVTYYFVNSTANGDCTLYPNGSMVQLPGDNYKITVVPNDSGDTVSMTDNNVDVTSQLERKEMQIEKGGVTTTVVNYIYNINNVQATHNLVATSTPNGLLAFIKESGQWEQGTMSRKGNDSWGELTYTRIWVHNGTTWVENAQRTITTKGIVFGGVINNL